MSSSPHRCQERRGHDHRDNRLRAADGRRHDGRRTSAGGPGHGPARGGRRGSGRDRRLVHDLEQAWQQEEARRRWSSPPPQATQAWTSPPQPPRAVSGIPDDAGRRMAWQHEGHRGLARCGREPPGTGRHEPLQARAGRHPGGVPDWRPFHQPHVSLTMPTPGRRLPLPMTTELSRSRAETWYDTRVGPTKRPGTGRSWARWGRCSAGLRRGHRDAPAPARCQHRERMTDTAAGPDQRASADEARSCTPRTDGPVVIGSPPPDPSTRS